MIARQHRAAEFRDKLSGERALNRVRFGANRPHAAGGTEIQLVLLREPWRGTVAAEAEITYEVNHRDGFIVLEIGSRALPADVTIDRQYVREVLEPKELDEAKVLVTYAGFGSKWSNNVITRCSVGFMYQWNGGPYRGFGTAAHCNDPPQTRKFYRDTNSNSVYGESWDPTPGWENCATDVELTGVDGGAGDYAYASNISSKYFSFKIAGGYFIGQFAATAGAVTHFNVGDITSFGATLRPGGADCPNAAWQTGPTLDVANDIGDSGGPIFFEYYGWWYLGGIISYGDASSTTGPFIHYMGLPSQVQICNYNHPCNSS